MKSSSLAVALLSLAGCSSAPEVPKMKMAMGVPDGQVKYKTVSTETLSLRLLSNTDLYAGEKAEGAVMASDAFFPFPDCVEAAAKAGIKAIIQPGGSIRDNESIEACDKYGIAMVFVGMRHFKH